MAYKFTNSKGKDYFLHVKKTTRSSGNVTELYYFTAKPSEDAGVDTLPAGKVVVELATGLPVLKKQ